MTTENTGYARLFKNFENVIEPKECTVTGTVPSWLKGTMVRNGPGMFEIGDTKYNHWFDGLGYMQRYHFEDGKMYYSARFLESDSYKENMAKNRIVRGSFGTVAFPDPCKTIFQRFFSTFTPDTDIHDNANVAFTPVGDGIYACTETPHMYRVDLDTLDTKDYVDMGQLVSLHTCTAHQLYDEAGDVYNIGGRYGKDSYYVFTKTKNPKNGLSESDHSWEHTEMIGEIKTTDSLLPTYMHSFGMSKNYLVMFEAPIRLSLKKMLMRKVIPATYRECLYWDETKNVNVLILDKNTGKQHEVKYTVDPFFTFHHANTFEKDGCIVVDYCRIEKAGNFDTLLIENMKTGTFKNNPKMLPFLSRLIIPLNIPKSAKSGDNLLSSMSWASGCTAVLQEDGSIKLTEKRTCDMSMEFPRYHWEKINMKEYQYVFGSSVLGEHRVQEMVGVVKADLLTGKHLKWRLENQHQICGEPIFVPNPAGVKEDDGILIVPVMTLNDDQNPFVLILNAVDLKEMARFTIPEARIPLGFHAFYRSKLC